MRTKLMITLAATAALTVGSGIASAQGPGAASGGTEAPRGVAEGGERSASPADTKAPTTKSDRREPSSKAGTGARDGTGAPGANERSQNPQVEQRSERDRNTTSGARNHDGEQAGEGRDRGAREENGAADRDRTRTEVERRKPEHAGRRITSEQRSRVKTLFGQRRSEALHDVHFARRLGTVIPADYRFRPLPSDIVEFLPEYRGFDYILVDDEIIILEPGTRRIVDIID